jgi:hypothetical protein
VAVAKVAAVQNNDRFWRWLDRECRSSVACFCRNPPVWAVSAAQCCIELELSQKSSTHIRDATFVT